MKRKEQPFFTYVLAVINIVIFFILELGGDTEGDIAYMIRCGALSVPHVTEQGEYWRFLSATFLHFGFEHLLNNMFLLLCAGQILEKALGHVKFLILYLCSGVGGCMLSFGQMIYSGDYKIAAGASGAIFGIIGALFVIVIRHKGRYETLTGQGLFFMIVLSLYYGIRTGGIDNWGHIGGLLMGFLGGMVFYRKRKKSVDFSEKSSYTY